MMTRKLSLLLCVAATGCGGTETSSGGNGGAAPTVAAAAAVSCIYTEVASMEGGTFTTTFCMEPPGLSANDVPGFRSGCETQISMEGGVSMTVSGVFASQGCSRANLAGGCQKASGSMLLTIWYYADGVMTADLVKQACAAQGGAFVTP
jgi:hypothetical protein